MPCSPTGHRCRSLLLVTISSILLSTAAAYDYNVRPKPVFDFEDRASFGLGNRVENEPRGSHAADAPSLPASTASGPALHDSFQASFRDPSQAPSALEESAALLQSLLRVPSAQEVYAAVERDFEDAPLGEVVSAAREEEETPSGRPVLDARGPGPRPSGTGSKTEGDGSVVTGSGQGEPSVDKEDAEDADDAEDHKGHEGHEVDHETSNLGVFNSPRPELSDPALYNRRLCENPDGSQGVCHESQLSCKLRGGAFSHKCSGGNGVCCVFEHSCSAFTRERVSYYRNPDFPNNSTGNLICNYKVKIQPGICGLRVDFMNYTTEITPECTETQLSVLVGGRTRTIPHCGVLTGYSMVFDSLDATRDKEAVISHILGGTEPYRFDIRVTQLLCSAVKPIPEENACGRQNLGMVRHRRAPRPLQVFTPPAEGSTSLFPTGDPELTLELDTASLQSGNLVSTRILGGREAEVNEWPWQVALLKKVVSKSGTKARFFCGGTLINSEYIITAAHCVSKFKSVLHTDARPQVIVLLGDHDLSAFNESKHEIRRVSRILVHPLYDASRNQHDIALLRIHKPVDFAGNIAPACLPKEPRTFVGKDINVSGWGVVSFNNSRRGPTSVVLKTTTVKGISREECDKTWDKFDSPGTVYRELPHLTENQDCIGNTPGAACFGDSGGPITYQEEDSGRFTVLGAVSFGPPICEVGGEFPTIYSRVSAYLAWIQLAILEIF